MRNWSAFDEECYFGGIELGARVGGGGPVNFYGGEFVDGG